MVALSESVASMQRPLVTKPKARYCNWRTVQIIVCWTPAKTGFYTAYTMYLVNLFVVDDDAAAKGYDEHLVAVRGRCAWDALHGWPYHCMFVHRPQSVTGAMTSKRAASFWVSVRTCHHRTHTVCLAGWVGGWLGLVELRHYNEDVVRRKLARRLVTLLAVDHSTDWVPADSRRGDATWYACVGSRK